MVVAAAGTGIAGVAALVLAIAGVLSAVWPIVLLVACALCVVGFRNATGS
jgi:hypothetical protein